MKKALSVFLSLLLCFSCAVTVAADDDEFEIDSSGVFDYCPVLESITVAAGSLFFNSINGVLYAKAGETLYTCTVCGMTKPQTVPKNTENHTGGTELKNASAPTCGKAGYTGDTCCKGCGAVLTPGETIPATGNHTWDEGKITKAATASAEGEKTFTCGICKATKTPLHG